MFEVGGHAFAIESARLWVGILDRAEARARRIPTPALSIDVTAKGATVAGVPSALDFWTPKAYCESIGCDELGVRSLADLQRGVTAAREGTLYVFRHMRMRESELAITWREQRAHLEWTGTAAVHPTLPQYTLRVSTPLTFSVIVDAAEVDAAKALLREQFPGGDLEPGAVDILEPGRRKFLLFGPVIGRRGTVTFRLRPSIQ